MRKAPQQERSQFMVDTLIQATAAVFERRGLALTTRDVAEQAGVSVGSLYQYFKNKEELLSALVTQLGERVAEGAMRDIAEQMKLDYREFYRLQLTRIISLIDENPGYRAVARHWHELRTVEAVHATEQKLMEVARLHVMNHLEDYRPTDLPVALFIAYNSTVYTVMRYFSLKHPPFGVDRLIDELTNMMAAYMAQRQAEPPAAPTPR